MSALQQNNAPTAGQGDEGDDQNRDGAVMNIIPETDEARQAVREWAHSLNEAYGAWSGDEHSKLRDDFQPPEWPERLTPAWAKEVKISYLGLGEAGVSFMANHGESTVSAFISVIITRQWSHINPDKVVGDFVEYGIEINIDNPHEGMSLTEAEDVLASLARSIARMRSIQVVGA